MQRVKVDTPENFGSFSQYVLGLLSLVAITGLLYLLRNVLSTPIIALLYLLPVILSATVWGLGPGILTSLAAFLAFNYLFIPPFHTFAVWHTEDLLALIVFLLVAVVISQLLGMARAGILAATSREREATLLYELSMALSGLQEIPAIGQTLAGQICEAFRADRVEVTIQPGVAGQSFSCGSPAGASSSHPNSTSFPLATARGNHGSILIWRAASPLSSQEKRMLRTFASQGALAVEHSQLSEESNRARILEESDRLKSTLLSSVSHELRTPLATIKASVTSLRSDDGDLDQAARQELLSAIEEETDHLNLLVGNLLSSTRLELGALNPQKKWNSLAEIVRGVLRRMHQVTAHHILRVTVPEDLPSVSVDYFQMEQVFTNLISNSVKYAPVNTEIEISAREEPENKAIHIEVSNQSPPVPDQDLGRIFDKFYRITAADRVTGTGLGLSICKGIIEAHGGRIWAENGDGKFIFHISLPTGSEVQRAIMLTESTSS